METAQNLSKGMYFMSITSQRRILSRKQRIIEIESGFYPAQKSEAKDFDNLDLMNQYITKELGCLPIKKF